MTEESFEQATKNYLKSQYPVKRFVKRDPIKVGGLYTEAGLKNFLSSMDENTRERWYMGMNEKSRKELLNTIEGFVSLGYTRRQMV
jgi:hypothetical protein